MSNEIKTAIIAGGVAIIVAITNLVVNIIINKKNIKQLRYESTRIGITEKRMDWISNVRKLFADLFSYNFIDLYINKNSRLSMNSTIKLINLYLNFSGDIDREILNLINQLHELLFEQIEQDERIRPDYKDMSNRYSYIIDEIEKYAHVYLKSEWNRVKFESNPHNYDKTYEEVKEINKLIEQYDKTDEFCNDNHIREAERVNKLIEQYYKTDNFRKNNHVRETE